MKQKQNSVCCVPAHLCSCNIKITLVSSVSLMSLWEPEPPWLPGGPMAVGGGCKELGALFPGPDLGMGCPPLAEGPVGSNLLRSSRKASSFFDGLSAATRKISSTVTSSKSTEHNKIISYTRRVLKKKTFQDANEQ